MIGAILLAARSLVTRSFAAAARVDLSTYRFCENLSPNMAFCKSCKNKKLPRVMTFSASFA